MFFIKRALGALALAAVIAVLTPGLGFCVEEDLYIYRLLFARVYLEYETGTANDSGTTSTYSSFQQTYTLDTLGNILSRRLITYDAGLAYTLEDYEQGQTTIESKYVDYYLKTTLLPKSNIPLQLYGSRLHESTVTSMETERVKTIYGLQWFARFRTLPETRVMIESQNDKAQSTDQTTTNYNVNMNKSVGPTENFLSYSLNTTEDNLNSNNASESQAVNFRNRTNLSRSTIIDFGVSRGENTSDNPDNPESTVYGLTVGLQSKPSIDFSQDHRYTYYRLSTDGSDTENGLYSGNMNYIFTDRLSSNMNLSVGESTSETADKSEKSESLGVGFGLNYMLSRKLSLSETLSYTSSQSTASTDTTPDREIFRALTHLNYNDQLSWAQLSSSVRLGYNRDKTSEDLSGSGIEQGVSASLNNIDVNRYALFNTAADWNRVHNLTGDVWSESKSFNVAAFNKLWKRYALLSGKYSKSLQSSWIAATETDSQNWSFSATSTYFRNTKVEFSSDHSSTSDSVNGDLRTDTETLSVTHNRYLAGGSFDFGMTYSMISSSFQDGSDEFTSTTLFAKYDKKLARNIDWLASASLSRGDGSNDSFKNIESFSNRLTYPMRSWLLSAEQRYIHTEDQNRDLAENTLLFRAMRQFTWIL